MFNNKQLYLAEKHEWLERHVNKTSQRALLKIESLKMIAQSSDYNKQVKMAKKFVNEALLTPIQNHQILMNEGFYSANLTN